MMSAMKLSAGGMGARWIGNRCTVDSARFFVCGKTQIAAVKLGCLLALPIDMFSSVKHV